MCKKPADVKGKIFPLHSMRAYRGRRCVAPLVRISALRRWEVHFILRLLYHGGKSAVCRCNRGLGGPRAGMDYLVKRKMTCTCCIRTPDRPARRLAAIHRHTVRPPHFTIMLHSVYINQRTPW